MAHVPSPLFAPLYLAQDKGYFKEEGVEIELNPVAAGQDAVPLLSSNECDVIVAGFSAGFFSALDSGLKLKVVGSMSVTNADEGEDPPAALEVDSDLVDSGEVESPGDLEGLKIGVAGGLGGSGAYLTDLILREHGLDITDVEVSNIANSDMPAGLKSGSVDAVMTSAPYTEIIESDGDGIPLATVPDGTSGTGIIFSEDFADTDRADGFFRALARAAQDLQGDARRLKENVQPVADAMEVDPQVILDLPVFTWLPNLAPLPDQLEAMQRTWIDAGQLQYDEAIDPAEYVDESFAESVETTE
ncbi:ABC transporter substrate-binding protein [Nocardioides immobilis]|uniref:ABC transporter substrate-binding protein n=1 Tax=Nocardioides immobilis TaxID=2049295 RepID=UPI001C710762|nr:ABC transporter substrate-binding protein [Nocardioides immobilis]